MNMGMTNSESAFFTARARYAQLKRTIQVCRTARETALMAYASRYGMFISKNTEQERPATARSWGLGGS